MSLFPLKKHCLFLSLFLFSSLSLSLICFTGCRFVFFFLSFALLFVLGVNSKRWSSLSFSLVFGEIGNHIIRLSLSLSLSVKKRAFWKTRSPLRILRSTQKERGIISEKEEQTRARKQEKKDGLDVASHCGTNRSHTEASVASKTKTHTSERTNLCYLASAPAGHASKIHSSVVALIYIRVYST